VAAFKASHQRGHNKIICFSSCIGAKNAERKKLYKLHAYIITEVVPIEDTSNKVRIKTREYIYKISSVETGKALYEFHWHPEKIDRETLEPMKLEDTDKKPFPYPHSHVRISTEEIPDLYDKHIPSGRVAFEDVVQFLIGDNNIEPNRNDWQAVLDHNREVFRQLRKW
jgi:hypothetical protein